MRLRQYAARFSLALTAVTLAGACGGAKPKQDAKPQQRPIAHRSAVKLLPASDAVFMHADLTALRQSPHYPALRQLIEDALARESLQHLAHLNWELIDALSLSSESKEKGQVVRGSVVLKGRFTAKDIKQGLAQASDNPPKVEDVRVGNLQGLRLGDYVLLDLRQGTWVLEHQSRINSTLARAQAHKSDGLSSSKLYADFSSDIPFQRSTFAVLMDLKEMPERRVGWTNRAERAGLTAGLTSTFFGKARVDLESAEDAARVQQALQGQIDSLASKMMIKLLGWSSVLKRFTSRTDGSRLYIDWNLSDAETKKVVSQLSTLIGVLRRGTALNAGPGGN